MKKILTLAVVALMQCGTASAQVEVSAEIGYGLHDGGLGYDTYELDVAGAYRFGKHFSIGAGTGIGNIDYGGGTYKNAAFWPVFARARYNLLAKGWSPFAKMDYGYAFSLREHIGDHGLFFRPAIGLDIPLRKGKIYVQVGYTTRKLKTKVYLPGTQYGPGADFYEHGHHDMFDFSLGYTVSF